MIDWIHSLGNDWGHWLRKEEAKNGALEGTMGRIHKEGVYGACIRSYRADVPVVEFPEDVAAFHRAWLQIERHYQIVLFVDYRLKCNAEQKFSLVNKKRSAYYRLRDKAHSMISYEMALRQIPVIPG